MCIFKQQVIIQASFVKTTEHCLFIIFYFIFSRLLVIFLVSRSRHYKNNKKS